MFIIFSMFMSYYKYINIIFELLLNYALFCDNLYFILFSIFILLMLFFTIILFFIIFIILIFDLFLNYNMSY
jgi:hypothetical protein